MEKVAFKNVISYNIMEKKVHMKRNNKKEKINPMIKNQKKAKSIKVTEISEDENVVKKLIIITVIIAVFVGIIYVVTEFFKEEPQKNNDIVNGEINYDKVTVGTILNRPYDEYYVLIYNSEDPNAVLYSTILTRYMQKEDGIKIYFCDLNNKLNISYYNVESDNKSNSEATKVEEFDFSDLTLLKVQEGKIVKYLEDLASIKEILK